MGEETGVDKCDILTCGDEERFRVVESIHSIVEGGPSEGGVGQAETEEIPRYGQGKGALASLSQKADNVPAPTLQSTLEDENGSERTTDVGLKMWAENNGLMMQGNEVTEVMPGVPPVVSPSVSLPDAAVPLDGGMRAEAKARAERKMSLVQLRDNPLVQEMADRAALEMVSSSLLDMQKAGKIDVLRAVAVLRVGALSFHRTASAQIRQYCEVLDMLVGVDWRTVLEEEEAAAARRQDPISEAEFITARGEVNALVQPWEARGVPIAYTISVKGEVRVYFNECFVNGYLRDATQVKEFSSPNVVPLLLWRRVIVPEDQLFFFTAMTSCIVSQEGPPGSREVAVLVRCFQYDGAEVLSEVRYRVLYSTHGFAQAFSIHPLTFDETLAEEEKRRREAANPTPTFRVYTPS